MRHLAYASFDQCDTWSKTYVDQARHFDQIHKDENKKIGLENFEEFYYNLYYYNFYNEFAK